MEKHFVTFYYPRRWISTDDATLEIASWDIDTAMKVASGLKGRGDNYPYGFRFSTCPDAGAVATAENRSAIYYIGGLVQTIEDARKFAGEGDAYILSECKRKGFNRVLMDPVHKIVIIALKDEDIVIDQKNVYKAADGQAQRYQGFWGRLRNWF
jgi:hypothetical protein